MTGVGHRLNAYLALPEGWREPPPGTWSDHYMWQQWFRLPSLRFSTGDEVTVLKFYAEAREGHVRRRAASGTDGLVRQEHAAGLPSTLAASAGTALRCKAVRLSLDLEAVSEDVVDTRMSLELLQTEYGVVQAELKAVQAELNVAQVELMAARDASDARAAEAEDARTTARELQVSLDAVRGTRTWRLHDWLARSSVFGWLARR